ncbi:CHASE2 domain-containing protein [Methylobrevis pamukkalensis]|uniref:Adenylate cyclase 1 n=1 Tax=Methylobrevis pamukkalensis TaxID=1439726 RepID=A0A1E3H829_9HYPH|nr:adenylate/guanylate cyclase domain-containing protein [Methylobrevis pamukkalensis]ODN72488.1 Adenylate cyclase 1 [Methylobrevis pamukkalensis]
MTRAPARSRFRLRLRLRAMLAGLGAAAAAALVTGLFPSATVERWREAATDLLLLADPPPPSGRVVVVDIDAASLHALGPWPWPRDTMAGLVERIATGLPRAVAFDMVFAGADRTAPATLAARLLEDTGDPALAAAIAALPDPDARLAVALSAVPAVLGVLMSDQAGAEIPDVPLLLEGAAETVAPWRSAGAVLPHAPLAGEAAGLGVASLEDTGDGTIRKVPLLAVAGTAVVPGLAAETLRTAEAAGSYILRPGTGDLRIGAHLLPVSRDLSLRLRPSRPDTWPLRTVSAADVVAGRVPPQRLEDRIVLIGGSAPSLGALRAGAASPVVPSVQLQADALETMLSDRVPVRPDKAWMVEAGAALLLAVAGALLGASASPLMAVTLGGLAALLWPIGTTLLYLRSGWLVDPLSPPLLGLLAMMVAGTVSAMAARREAAAVRRRFERHLAPAVVARIVDNPDLVRLDGERRDITVLFTDIEGFTAVADRLAPADLVRLLDRYFEGVTAAIIAEGGMVDKFVGDAVHAYFNAPLDLGDHPRRALAAARTVASFAARFAQDEAARSAGLGRTRIGIESGEVVLGDVGAGDKLDYTAHGSAVNTAARLEALNKTFGTTICVGPAFRARLPDEPFRSLGRIDVRGRGMLEVFTPDERTD